MWKTKQLGEISAIVPKVTDPWEIWSFVRIDGAGGNLGIHIDIYIWANLSVLGICGSVGFWRGVIFFVFVYFCTYAYMCMCVCVYVRNKKEKEETERNQQFSWELNCWFGRWEVLGGSLGLWFGCVRDS